MSTEAAARGGPLDPAEQLRYAREIIRIEAQALLKCSGRLDREFCQAVELLFACEGSVIVTGMGKAGLIGQKVSATLASTGTRSHFLHPGEALHGDLGRVHRSDLLLILSQSGETGEVIQLLPSLAEFGVSIIAITGRRHSTLGRAAAVTLDLGPQQEACSLGLAPSTSTTAMLALGDALALVVSRMRCFRAEDFARFHPGGSLGRKLSKVEDYMRPIEQCRIAIESLSVREAFSMRSSSGRRTGAIMITSGDGVLQGIFTDSDLARLFENHREGSLDEPIQAVMTAHPSTAPHGAMLNDAMQILAERKISELPVIDPEGRPLGLIDITDVAALLPEDAPPSASTNSSPAAGSREIPKPKILIFPHTSSPGDRKA